MASTPAGRELTEAYRLAQSRLGATTTQQMLTAWRLIDPYDLTSTVPQWLQIAEAIVAAQHQKSVALGSGYARAFRAVELGALQGVQVVPGVLDLAAVNTSLTVTGPVALKRATAQGLPVAEAAERSAADTSREAMRHAMSGGRDTVTRTAQADPQALGVARATSGNSCAFCAVLASRGPVYFSEETAGFEAHAGCHCEPETVYSREASWPAGSEQYADLYAEHAQGEPDPLNAFRRAYTAQQDAA